MVNQLRLIEIFVEELHHFVPHFHPDADVHGSRRGVNPDFTAFGVEPVGALPAHGGNDFTGIEVFAFIRPDSHGPALFQKNFLHHGIEFQHHARFFQMMLQFFVNFIPFLRS